MDLFEKATKMHLRFNLPNGILQSEDLWDLPLTSKNGVSLDDLAKQLYKAIKESDEISFVKPINKKDDILQTKFNVVKRIIEVRLEEREQAKIAAKKKEEAEILKAIIAKKQNEALEGESLEELQKRLKKLMES